MNKTWRDTARWFETATGLCLRPDVTSLENANTWPLKFVSCPQIGVTPPHSLHRVRT